MPIQRSRSRRASLPAIRNRRGEEPIKITATDAKNRFGELLESVLQGGTVLITKHETPKAVVLSVTEYDALSHATQTGLDGLTGEFDALLARMQTAKSRAGMNAAFAASPRQLGKFLIEGLEDIREDRVRGPFQSAAAQLHSLHRTKKNKKT